MRTHVVIGVVAMVVGLGMGLGARVHASQDMLVFGTATAAENEVEEGYFAVGRDAYLVLKPGSPAHEWMKRQIGQRVAITLSAADTLNR